MGEGGVQYVRVERVPLGNEAWQVMVMEGEKESVWLGIMTYICWGVCCL
jgi:hypothetical protein